MQQHVFPNPVLLPKDVPIIESDRLAMLLGNTSRQLIYTWRKRKGFPQFFKSRNKSFYMTQDVMNWLEENHIEAELT